MSSIPPLKRCSKCGVEKPLDQFHKHPKSPDGLRPICKACVKAYQQQWRNDPRYADAIRERDRQRQQSEDRRSMQRVYGRKAYHSETAKAKRQAETEQNRNQRQQARQAQLSDPVYQEEQRRKARVKKSTPQALAQRRKRRADRYQNEPGYRDRTLQQQGARFSRYYEKQYNRHKERYNNDPEYRKRYNARVNAHVHKRRAKSHGSHTAAEWDTLCAKYNHCCLCCGSDGPVTKDHIQPIMRGGSNNIDNLQPLCLTCNLRKGTQTIDYRPLEQD